MVKKMKTIVLGLLPMGLLPVCLLHGPPCAGHLAKSLRSAAWMAGPAAQATSLVAWMRLLPGRVRLQHKFPAHERRRRIL